MTQVANFLLFTCYLFHELGYLLFSINLENNNSLHLSVNVNTIQDGGTKKASYRFFPSNFYKRKTYHSKISDF